LNAPEKVISSKRLFSGKVFSLREDVLSSAGREYVRQVVEHPGAVAVLPLLDAEKLVLIRQWRHAANRFLLEIPAGTLEPGEDLETCAARELEEETGFRAERLQKLSSFFVAPGYSSEEIHLFLGRGLRRSSSRPEEDEHIRLEITKLSDAVEMIRRGEIIDAKTVIALLIFKQFQDGNLRS